MESTTGNKIENGVNAAAGVAGVAAVFVPEPVVRAALTAFATYGPDAAHKIVEIWEKKDRITVEDLKGYFANLKPYEAYGIPDKVG